MGGIRDSGFRVEALSWEPEAGVGPGIPNWKLATGDWKLVTEQKRKYRSSAWFGPPDKDGFIHRSWVGRGLPEGIFDGRPVIGICNTWSELTPCNAHFRELAEHVKRGVWEAGGFPLEFPVMSLGETSCGRRRCCSAISRAWTSRNRSAATRSTASCCCCGCDKTTPSLIMGAASCDLPAHRGLRRADAERQVPRRGHRLRHGRLALQRGGARPATMSLQEFMQAESCMSRSAGTCNDHGHGVDDGGMAEALGMALPRQRGDSRGRLAPLSRRRSSPAGASSRWSSEDMPHVEDPDARRVRECDPRERRRSAARPTPCIHLLAIAGRVGVPLDAGGLGRARPRRADASST